MRPDQRPWSRLLFWSVLGTGISVIALVTVTVAERLATQKPMNENTWIIAVLGVVMIIAGPITARLAWRRFHSR